MMFPEVTPLSNVGLNILKKRYFWAGETTWEQLTDRVMSAVLSDVPEEQYQLTRELLLNRYFIPNSPCMVNAGREGGGLAACFVVDFPDTIEGIYKTKLDYALIARKGGGCGTTLSKIRPEGSLVHGSTHGYASGPINFFNTICHDMEVISQGGFRSMAMMGTMSVYHPDILKFITAKEQEGKMSTTNISVVVDNAFMNKVRNGEKYWTVFDGVQYEELYATDVFHALVEGAWKNGEPGILFYDEMNDSPYKYSGQEIMATNPCGEQPLPFNGVCNLGSLDICKFLDQDNEMDWARFKVAVRLGVRFLDQVVTKSSYPTPEITQWVADNLPIGLGIMGYADYLLHREIAYGSKQALDELEEIMAFMALIADEESIALGSEIGVSKSGGLLERPRRNVTTISIAPTGTISLIAGCNSGIEPIFSEITVRNDKTGSYQFENDLAEKPYFRCAVASNGATEVTWEEHVRTQASAQKFVDSGVSKTINFPNHIHRETIYKAFMLAWELKCKGITCYRNGSRKVEVLQPKELKKDRCPLCGADLIKYDGCKKCSKCEFNLCENS